MGHCVRSPREAARGVTRAIRPNNMAITRCQQLNQLINLLGGQLCMWLWTRQCGSTASRITLMRDTAAGLIVFQRSINHHQSSSIMCHGKKHATISASSGQWNSHSTVQIKYVVQICSPPGESVIIIIKITGPNENSQKSSISVNVLAANRQDAVYEWTTRPNKNWSEWKLTKSK